MGILEQGRNCWRIERAERAAVLVDAAAYFAAVRRAILDARRQVLILGWDVDSRIALVRDAQDDGAPVVLRELLSFCVERRPELHVHVLLWDFAVLYALEREPLPSINLEARTPARVHVELDGSIPLGGSHHQKMVVVDDRLAFVGGLDLADARWDTPEHRPDEPRRVLVNGRPHEPFHDVQLAVDGDVAGALGELARARWQASTGDALAAPSVVEDPWPGDLEPDVHDASIGIARTVPRHESDHSVREVERLYLDAIASARRHLYIENQYFTSETLGNALAARLHEDDGPEILALMPATCSGWLEENTMGLLRSRLLERLRAADRHGRFRACRALLGDGTSLMVHAKVLIADGRLAIVGSSNFSERSLGIDSECDLAVEAETEQVGRAIARARDRLLGEHLGATPDEVAASLEETGSMLATVDALGSGERRLETLEPGDFLPPALEAVKAVSDPDGPLEAEGAIEEFRDRVVEGTAQRADLLALFSVGVLVVALALAWQYTDLRALVSVESTARWIEDARTSATLPLVLLGIYLVGGLMAFPITVLNAAVAIAVGPWLGFAYALAGSVASAAATFVVGRRLGSRALRRCSSGLVYRVSHAVAERGFAAMLSVRFVPVAPFTVVNLVAGAMPIRFRDYLLGTLFGMAPGVAVLAAFGHRVEQVLHDPDPLNIALLLVLVGVWVSLGWLLHRAMTLFEERRGRRAPDAEEEAA